MLTTIPPTHINSHFGNLSLSLSLSVSVSLPFSSLLPLRRSSQLAGLWRPHYHPRLGCLQPWSSSGTHGLYVKRQKPGLGLSLCLGEQTTAQLYCPFPGVIRRPQKTRECKKTSVARMEPAPSARMPTDHCTEVQGPSKGRSCSLHWGPNPLDSQLHRPPPSRGAITDLGWPCWVRVQLGLGLGPYLSCSPLHPWILTDGAGTP